MLIPNAYQTRLLTVFDAAEVESVYDSQPKLMLIPKAPGALPYSKTFVSLLTSGCYAYGAFKGGKLYAFSIFFSWPDLPATTLVLSCCRPTGGVYRPDKSGFAAALDAAILHAEKDSRYMIFALRSADKKWDHKTVVSERVGRFFQYRSTIAEHIKAGTMSKFQTINQLVLGLRPVSADAVLICSIAPWGNEPPSDSEP